MNTDPWPRLTALIRNTRTDLRYRSVERDETMAALNEADYRNIECLVEYQRRKLFGFRYRDIRGDLTGPAFDQDYEDKRRVARALMKDLSTTRILRSVWTTKISGLLRRQAN